MDSAERELNYERDWRVEEWTRIFEDKMKERELDRFSGYEKPDFTPQPSVAKALESLQQWVGHATPLPTVCPEDVDTNAFNVVKEVTERIDNGIRAAQARAEVYNQQINQLKIRANSLVDQIESLESENAKLFELFNKLKFLSVEATSRIETSLSELNQNVCNLGGDCIDDALIFHE